MLVLASIIAFAPLVGAIIAGLGGDAIGRGGAHRVTIGLMGVSFVASLVLFAKIVLFDGQPYNGALYTWATSGAFRFDIGFLLDSFTAVMAVIVTFISLIVHIYSIGYMKDDPGYQRFFSYMSFFTFFMLMLVMANNFLQLYFGWEGVGLVSYLLIGFWFHTEPANIGSLKAFIVNRVGDMGFLLGLAAILDYCGSLDYATVFNHASNLANTTINIIPGHAWPVITVICVLLFIGAMAKSAQIPLHVWLPASMAGPTPISALIHAATMVTAGIYMVARMSPLYELSVPALSLVLVIGATGGLFLGLLAFVENDIKRVIAYSTMSQLGYMMAGNGASAFSAAIFHLLNHACFKALLFLAAGSVIIAMHHEQDLRKMGNLRRYMPITYITFLVGGLALAAIPPFSGFYSKDAIIEAVHTATIPGADYAFICLLLGTFVTGYYTFRAFFLAFHGKERMSADVQAHLREPEWTLTLPLIVLAIPSVFLGMMLVGKMLYQVPDLLGNGVYVAPHLNVLGQMSAEYHGFIQYALAAFIHPAVWLALLGIFTAWLTCVKYPEWRHQLAQKLPFLTFILEEGYGFDAFNHKVIVQGTKRMSNFFFHKTDVQFIDAMLVDGSGRGISRISRWLRRLQSGYLYHYALIMIAGLLVFLCWRLYF